MGSCFLSPSSLPLSVSEETLPSHLLSIPAESHIFLLSLKTSSYHSSASMPTHIRVHKYSPYLFSKSILENTTSPETKNPESVLAGVAQWIEHWPANQGIASSIPSQGTCLVYRPGPQQAAHERQPHIGVSLPLSPSLPLSKINN